MMKAASLLCGVVVPLSLLAVCAVATAADVAGALKAQQGKRVTLVLGSGTELTGKLTAVDDDTATLSELSGKEFFDAVVDLDEVEAVVYRVRDR